MNLATSDIGIPMRLATLLVSARSPQDGALSDRKKLIILLLNQKQLENH